MRWRCQGVGEIMALIVALRLLLVAFQVGFCANGQFGFDYVREVQKAGVEIHSRKDVPILYLANRWCYLVYCCYYWISKYFLVLAWLEPEYSSLEIRGGYLMSLFFNDGT